jgi:hypothetical protein
MPPANAVTVLTWLVVINIVLTLILLWRTLAQ